METIGDALKQYAKAHDFNKQLGVIAKATAVNKLSEYFDSPKLKIELNKCTNLTQMANTIEQGTGALTKKRTPEELLKFRAGFERLLKLSGL